MNGLLAEVAAKRKAITDDKLNTRPTKYMRRGEIERLREEEERKEKEEKEAKEAEEQRQKEELRASKVGSSISSLCQWPNSPLENRLLGYLLARLIQNHEMVSLRSLIQHSISPTRKLYIVFAQRANPSGSLQNQTRIVDFDSVL